MIGQLDPCARHKVRCCNNNKECKNDETIVQQPNHAYPGIALPLASRAEWLSILHTLNDDFFSVSGNRLNAVSTTSERTMFCDVNMLCSIPYVAITTKRVRTSPLHSEWTTNAKVNCCTFAVHHPNRWQARKRGKRECSGSWE